MMIPLLPVTFLLAMAAAPTGKIALVDLDTTMIGMASQVTAALKEAAAAQKLTLVSPDELRTRLGQKRYGELMKCAGKVACVSQALGDVTDITRVISGSLAVDEKFYLLRLVLIDLRSLEVVGEVDSLDSDRLSPVSQGRQGARRAVAAR